MPDQPTEIERLLIEFWRFDNSYERVALFGVLAALRVTETEMREELSLLSDICAIRSAYITEPIFL